MIRYPNGPVFNTEKKEKKTKLELSVSSANRGMDLESDINISNQYYKEKGIALIYKRPTPINIVKVDYSHGAKITDAYFERQSTTDYNGVYKGHYLDFEAKMTKSKTSFPLHNISKHQIEHLKLVKKHGGIAFFIVSFATLDKVFLMDAQNIIDFYESNERKSIPLKAFEEKAVEIKRGFNPRLFYIEALEIMLK